jgi:hypothetical protein
MVGAPRYRPRGVIIRMPLVSLEDDSPERAMATCGILIGLGRARAVWRFGFIPGTLLALAFHVATVRPLWVLALHDGRPLETISGAWDIRLPIKFRNTLEAGL